MLLIGWNKQVYRRILFTCNVSEPYKTNYVQIIAFYVFDFNNRRFKFKQGCFNEVNFVKPFLT